MYYEQVVVKTVRVAIRAKSLILCVLFLILFVLELRVVIDAKLVISGILSSILLILALYTSFSTTLFLQLHLVCLNQHEQVLIYQHRIYLIYFLNCLNYVVHFSIYQSLIRLDQ